VVTHRLHIVNIVKTQCKHIQTQWEHTVKQSGTHRQNTSVTHGKTTSYNLETSSNHTLNIANKTWQHIVKQTGNNRQHTCKTSSTKWQHIVKHKWSTSGTHGNRAQEQTGSRHMYTEHSFLIRRNTRHNLRKRAPLISNLSDDEFRFLLSFDIV
jgi:hypothetical protein